MSNPVKPPTPEGSQESGVMIFLRVIGLLVVGPALFLYVVSLLVS